MIYFDPKCVGLAENYKSLVQLWQPYKTKKKQKIVNIPFL